MACAAVGAIKRDYVGNARISFSSYPQSGLNVRIRTVRLLIESITPMDLASMTELYSDKNVMEKFASGVPKTQAEIAFLVNRYVMRWSNEDPHSGLAIRGKSDEAFIGIVVLGHGDRPGESEIAIVLHKKFWGSGIGTEVVEAIVKEYAPAIVEEGYTLEGRPLAKVVATARGDNAGSIGIMRKVGMRCVGEGEKFGARRVFYETDITVPERITREKVASLCNCLF